MTQTHVRHHDESESGKVSTRGRFVSLRRRLPWVLLTLSVAQIAGAMLLGVHVDPTGLASVFFVLGFGLVGAVVASRRPRHPIGWVLLVGSFCFATGGLWITYVEHPASFPINPLVVWLANLSFGLGAGISATFLLLLFPNGHLPSPRWRPIAWLAGVGLGAFLLGVVLSPEPFEHLPIDSPLDLEIDPLLFAGGFYLFLMTVGASVASLVLRFRRANGEERQQLKWVALAVVVIAIGFLGTLVWELANGPAEVSEDVENFVVAFSLSLLPVAIGIAILRYRLFEIDRIISRTVSYALIAIVLAAVYIGGVIGLQNLIPASGDLAVAASTLAAAALFNPLRRRVQHWVDRRFNRRRFDAGRVVDGFGVRLREAVDLTTITTDLRAVVTRTVEPVSAAVWVRGDVLSGEIGYGSFRRDRLHRSGGDM
jgi:hypothetical protein